MTVEVEDQLIDLQTVHTETSGLKDFPQLTSEAEKSLAASFGKVGFSSCAYKKKGCTLSHIHLLM